MYWGYTHYVHDKVWKNKALKKCILSKKQLEAIRSLSHLHLDDNLVNAIEI